MTRNRVLNSQFQVMVCYETSPPIARQNPGIGGNLGSFMATGNSTGSYEVTVSYSGSPNLKINQLLQATGSADPALRARPLRILTLDPIGKSFTAECMRGAVPGASSSFPLQQIVAGDMVGNNPYGPDYWIKQDATMWLEDDGLPIRAILGVGVRPRTAGSLFYQALTPQQARPFWGQQMVFGMQICQGAKTGGGTARLFMDGGPSRVIGASILGNGRWEWPQPVTTTIQPGSGMAFGAILDNVGDPYTMCLPNLNEGSAMADWCYVRNAPEYLVPFGNNSPWNNVTVAIPTTPLFNGLYGLPFDIYCETQGRTHWSIAGLHVEFERQSGAQNDYDGWMFPYANGAIQLGAGAIYTDTPSVKGCSNGRLTLVSGRTYKYGKTGMTLSNASLDVPGYFLSD